MIDSFHSSGNSSLLNMEFISLLISERIVLTPAMISFAGICSIPGDLCLVAHQEPSHLKDIELRHLKHCYMYFMRFNYVH